MLFKHLPRRGDQSVLELGCGTGLFWRLNHPEIPKDWRITLTDYSRGMLETPQRNLHGIDRQFHFETANAEDLRYANESFDIVIANLMLYHVPDRAATLSGIARILKPSIVLLASTFGQRDMLELNLLLYRYLTDIGKPKSLRDNSFSLENGRGQLEPFFSGLNCYGMRTTWKYPRPSRSFNISNRSIP